MRVFDGVLYNGEADMLDVRLSHLEDVVDKFIILEGESTFMGRAKKTGLEERHLNHPKVVYRTFAYGGPWGWAAEHAQRNHLFRLVEEFEPAVDDVVTVCDCDEIWDPADVMALSDGVWRAWVMKRTVMSVYWRLDDEFTAVGGTWGSRPISAQQARSGRYSMPVLRSGWHLSWMGGPEWAANKMREFCHQELMVADPEAFMANNYTIGRSIRGEDLFEDTELDPRLPKLILDGKAPASWYRSRQ
jgi:beta-1,4-mannosyl-glycoprotein beta-1,4-N-acetylglucosaminyltransferase